MYSSVPTIAPNCVNSVFSVSRWPIALATPKSITLGTGLPSYRRDQDVGGLDVAVDDPLLVGVLDRLADGDEELQPLAGRQPGLVAVIRDRDALHQLHDEVGTAGVGGAGVEDPGDVGVIHHRQRLPLGLEPGDDLGVVHARLDELERDPATDRPLLLGHVDDAEAPLADRLEDLVRSDPRAEHLDRRGGQ